MLLQCRACCYSVGHVVTVSGVLSVPDGSLSTIYVVQLSKDYHSRREQILQQQFVLALSYLCCVRNNTNIFLLTVSAVKLPRYRHDVPLEEVGGCCRSFLAVVHRLAHVFQQLVDLFLR